IKRVSTNILPGNELSFFDSTNLITKGAKGSGLEIINYQTDIKKTIPSITISVEGSIKEVLSFLLLLETYSDTVSTYYLMVRFNTFKNLYNLTASLNYHADEKKHEGDTP
ncbi:MAG: hypothetical protein L3J12_09400, partial [Spirochaetales bacterium]|nr:hypothetical protein [Spirochaetales bacterium]